MPDMGSVMSARKLEDVIADLSAEHDDLTIYATEPSTCDSDAVVAREPMNGGAPREAKAKGAVYFIEVFIAKEFLRRWSAAKGRGSSTRQRCERLIHYAIHDA
ncbi:MAG: hypothetical protein ACOCUS_03430 [Polyangiales bacterium]